MRNKFNVLIHLTQVLLFLLLQVSHLKRKLILNHANERVLLSAELKIYKHAKKVCQTNKKSLDIYT